MGIKNILVPQDQIGFDSALVIWQTDPGEEMTFDGVFFGIGTLDQDTGESLDDDGDTEHAVVITGLIPGTQYTVQPHSRLDGSRTPLPYDGPESATFSTIAEPVSQPGEVASLDFRAVRHVANVGQPVVLTLKALGGGGSIAGKSISISAINGTPGGAPRGSFQPEVPTVGADPSNVCEVQFTPDHKGRAWVMAKVDNACARFRLLVRS